MLLSSYREVSLICRRCLISGLPLSVQYQKSSPKIVELNEKYKDLSAPERSEDIYLKVLSGGENE